MSSTVENLMDARKGPGKPSASQKDKQLLFEKRTSKMRKAQTFAKRIVEWDLLIANLKPHLEEMPYLQEIVTELETLVATAKALDSQQEVARGVLQDAVHQRQDIEREGEVLRRRAASHLRGSFGFTSDDLVKFGVRPRPRPTAPRKSKKKKKPADTPAPPAQ